MLQHQAVFLDRDGVLNRERGAYTYHPGHFELLPGVCKSLHRLQAAGFKLIVITNQGGISKGVYTAEDVWHCHHYLMQACGIRLDDLFFAPMHPSISRSLAFKPQSLMLERALALHHINPSRSWMVGDSTRDIEAARKVGLRTIFISGKKEAACESADYTAHSLAEATGIILQASTKEN
jgi:D-glycero-D-manno-heptose 1,7-bisphosphate phosphatase